MVTPDQQRDDLIVWRKVDVLFGSYDAAVWDLASVALRVDPGDAACMVLGELANLQRSIR